jgi:hypothetical protein
LVGGGVVLAVSGTVSFFDAAVKGDTANLASESIALRLDTTPDIKELLEVVGVESW